MAGVRWLREVPRGAPKANKARIDNMSVFTNTAKARTSKRREKNVDSLASKAARWSYADKANRIKQKLVGDARGRKAFDIATGIRKPDLKLKDVGVTMILFREKEADPTAEKRNQNQAK
jgi:hypothetical protein